MHGPRKGRRATLSSWHTRVWGWHVSATTRTVTAQQLKMAGSPPASATTALTVQAAAAVPAAAAAVPVAMTALQAAAAAAPAVPLRARGVMSRQTAAAECCTWTSGPTPAQQLSPCLRAQQATVYLRFNDALQAPTSYPCKPQRSLASLLCPSLTLSALVLPPLPSLLRARSIPHCSSCSIAPSLITTSPASAPPRY